MPAPALTRKNYLVYRLLTERPATPESLAKRLELSAHAVRMRLEDLVSLGYAERSYWVNEAGVVGKPGYRKKVEMWEGAKPPPPKERKDKAKEYRRVYPRKFGVGDDAWVFDPNQRVYDGSSLGPVYGGHYRRLRVEGIEGKSYKLREVPRTPSLCSLPTFLVGFQKAEKEYKTSQEKEDDVYVQTHKNKLAELVRGADAPTLRKVADILGYKGTDT